MMVVVVAWRVSESRQEAHQANRDSGTSDFALKGHPTPLTVQPFPFLHHFYVRDRWWRVTRCMHGF